jgi:hypothetical protein
MQSGKAGYEGIWGCDAYCARETQFRQNGRGMGGIDRGPWGTRVWAYTVIPQGAMWGGNTFKHCLVLSLRPPPGNQAMLHTATHEQPRTSHATLEGSKGGSHRGGVRVCAAYPGHRKTISQEGPVVCTEAPGGCSQRGHLLAAASTHIRVSVCTKGSE